MQLPPLLASATYGVLLGIHGAVHTQAAYRSCGRILALGSRARFDRQRQGGRPGRAPIGQVDLKRSGEKSDACPLSSAADGRPTRLTLPRSRRLCAYERVKKMYAPTTPLDCSPFSCIVQKLPSRIKGK
jgi:hypothetical protein